jgi:hypothetical protein
MRPAHGHARLERDHDRPRWAAPDAGPRCASSRAPGVCGAPIDTSRGAARACESDPRGPLSPRELVPGGLPSLRERRGNRRVRNRLTAVADDDLARSTPMTVIAQVRVVLLRPARARTSYDERAVRSREAPRVLLVRRRPGPRAPRGGRGTRRRRVRRAPHVGTESGSCRPSYCTDTRPRPALRRSGGCPCRTPVPLHHRRRRSASACRPSTSSAVSPSRTSNSPRAVSSGCGLSPPSPLSMQREHAGVALPPSVSS